MSRAPWYTRLGRWSDRRLLQRTPEYQLFLTEEARLRAIKELDEELEKNPAFWRGVVVIIVTATILANLSFCVVPMVSPWRAPGGGSGAAIVAWVIALGAVAAVVWTWRRGVIRRLRDKLIESGVPVCRACGYPMRGLDAPRCPECGWHADDAVRAILDEGPGAEERRGTVPFGDSPRAVPVAADAERKSGISIPGRG
jgi:hypothetical protein